MTYNKMNILKSYKEVLKDNYIIVYFIYFSFFLINGPFEKVISLLIQHNGFSEKSYGLFLSTINIVHIFLPGVVAYLANKFNSYKISMGAMIISLIAGVLAGQASDNSVLIFVWVMLIVCGRTIFNFSLGNSINYVLPENNRGKYFAMRDLFLFGAIAIGLLLGGIYIERFGINSFFTICSIIFLVPFILIFLLYKKLDATNKENNKEEIDNCKEENEDRRSNIKKIFYDKRFWVFIFIQIGTTIYSTAMSFLPFLGASLGISVSGIMTMFGSITIVNSIIALIIGHFSDGTGRKWIYVFDLAFDTIPAIIFIICNNVTLFIIGVGVTMLKDIFAPISFAYFFDCFEDENGVIILGLLSSIGNALSFIAPIIIGVLWVVSSKYVFFIGMIGNLLAALIAAIMLPNIKAKVE